MHHSITFEEVISKDFEDNHIPSNEEQADVLNQRYSQIARFNRFKLIT